MSDLAELCRQLQALGVSVRPEVRDGQLLLVPEGEMPDLSDATLRTRVIAIARSASFTHVSLEVVDDDATVHRDQPDD